MAEPRQIAVVIAARDAENEIGGAVASALRQPEVHEVVLVDDGSKDLTVAAALKGSQGSERLKIIRNEVSRGPAAARNLAIGASEAPLIAILDADDQFLPGRFQPLLRHGDFDLIADNVMFVQEMPHPVGRPEPQSGFNSPGEEITLTSFVEQNISRRGANRGELGFLKPVIRRAFLERHGLRYNEALRLGEDFDLYLRMLACGARFLTVRSCGYVALERPNSLSGRHRAADLAALAEADRQVLSTFTLSAEEERALRRHCHQIEGKHRYGRFLESKRQDGLLHALRNAAAQPQGLAAIALAIARDKAENWRQQLSGKPRTAEPRLLLPRA